MDLGGVLILVLEQPRLKEWIAATRGVSMAYSRSKAWYMVVRKLERVTEKNANTDADEGGCKLQTIMAWQRHVLNTSVPLPTQQSI